MESMNPLIRFGKSTNNRAKLICHRRRVADRHARWCAKQERTNELGVGAGNFNETVDQAEIDHIVKDVDTVITRH